MAVDYVKRGTIKPIIYWKHHKTGYLMLVPDSELLGTERLRRYMEKSGYILMAAETIQQAESLQNGLQEQMKREQEMELYKDEKMTEAGRKQVRDRLYARMNSSSTNPYEKEFIRIYLEGREKKHDIFMKRFTQQTGCLDALEYDNPNKRIHDLLDR